MNIDVLDVPDIRLVWTASDSPLGKLIRWFTKGQASHIFIEFPSEEWGGRWVAEATLSGVRMVPASLVRKHIVAEYQCFYEARPALRALRTYFGKSYDFSSLFVIAWAQFSLNYLGRKWKAPLRNTSEQFCSELSSRFLEFSAVDWLPHNHEQVTPQMILEFCRKSSMFGKVQDVI